MFDDCHSSSSCTTSMSLIVEMVEELLSSQSIAMLSGQKDLDCTITLQAAIQVGVEA